MTLRDALTAARALGLERLDAQLLLLHALGRAPHERGWLLAHDDDPLSPADQARWATLLQRRAAGEPLAYLTGHKAFYGLALQVDARVLDPRPDTETLVDWALDLHPLVGPALAVLDLGTGSGAIALALQQQRPGWRVWASDANADALAVAGANAARLGLPLVLRQGRWLAALAPQDGGAAGRFDLIVSNPPYVASADPHLAALRHEPLSALASGPDGLDDLRQIVAQAPARLAPGAWLLLEHGFDQAAAVRGLLGAAGFTRVQSRRDLAGLERCTGGQWPGPGKGMAEQG